MSVRYNRSRATPSGLIVALLAYFISRMDISLFVEIGYATQQDASAHVTGASRSASLSGLRRPWVASGWGLTENRSLETSKYTLNHTTAVQIS